jgi:thiol-disulfide isomerase/thioredoxin
LNGSFSRRAAGLLAGGALLLAALPALAFNFAPTGGAAVPEITFQDADGREHKLADFRGRVVVLNLWATWCAPCREEMPALDRLQAARGGPDLVVLALSLDRAGLDQIQAFYEEVGVRNLPIYRDPTAAAGRALRAPGLPTTLVIDRAGNEVGRVLGEAVWDGPEALELLDAVLAK